MNSEARVLVVEDNNFFRSLFIKHLKLEGYGNVFEAVNGREALEIIKEDDLDVILLDIQMPEMDGYQVLEALKADTNLRDIPVIVLSAVDEIESIVKCIELGAEDYLPKPVNATILRARLATCLDKKYLRDHEVIYLQEIQEEKRKLDELLSIILPSAAAVELKEKGFVEPRRFENVAILFCDVIQFTNYCDRTSPEQVVEDVTDLIECFEEITTKYGMEKIKTIGDEYMATAGLLLEINEPLISAINCGLDMTSAAPKLSCGWQVRVGVHIGSVVAGILGRQKYQFDLWGNSVNMAARMTSLGHPGVVTLTKDTWDKVSDDFHGDSLGIFDVKGKGKLEVIACKHK